MKTHPIHGKIRAGAFELGYTREGKGKTALVIGSSIYYPRTFSRELRQHLDLVFLDHRGFARAGQEVGLADYHLDHILADTEFARQTLALENIVIIGHSGHGYMALEYAKRYPQHVSHVVMIATGPSHHPRDMLLAEQSWEDLCNPLRKERLAADLALLPEEIAAAPDKRFITVCLRLAAKSWYDPTFDAAPLWQDVHVNMPMFDYMWGEVFRDLDVTQGLEQLHKPVLLALGHLDYLVAPFFTWETVRKNFHDLTIKLFERSGHTPQLEESQLFDAEFLRWLRRKS